MSSVDVDDGGNSQSERMGSQSGRRGRGGQYRGSWRPRNVQTRERRPESSGIKSNRRPNHGDTQNLQNLGENNQINEHSQRDNSSNGNRYNHSRKGNNRKPDKPHFNQKRPSSERQIKESSSDSQKDVFTQRLKKNQCDCMICCERMSRNHQIWHCLVCFNIFHLKCIRSWALKETGQSSSTGVWRCPACNAGTTDVPKEYRCFCGKVVNPSQTGYGECPHTCSQPCQRLCKTAQGIDESIQGHPCGMLCHPGSCGPCSAFIKRSCKCGRLSVPGQCAAMTTQLDCGESCGKTLTCGKHKCSQTCHSPPCKHCDITIPVACYCGNSIRSISCDNFVEGDEEANKFSCTEVCGKKLGCGNHFCAQVCHPGECHQCSRLPELVKSCPCGKMLLENHEPAFKPRVTCTDPIPTCQEKCNKRLNCGDGFIHFCPEVCHDSECQPCKQTVSIRCQCGRMTETFKCSDRPRPLTCVFRCNKKMSCRKHKCQNLCCTMGSDENSHVCAQPCNRLLSCGQHKCVGLCGHPGNCPPCYNASFVELSCYCGNTILYPPVPCGAKPPPCDRLCTREQACSHPAKHNCHPELPCPPCMVPVKCRCVGGHQEKYVPCSTLVNTVTCGQVCDKILPCGHRCSRMCHAGECTDQKCRELCQLPRQSGCGHPCFLYCHEPSPCPPPESTPCTFEVEYTCRCGLRVSRTQCPGSGDGIKALQISCDDKCALAERNRRLAEALQITDAPLLPQAPITVYPAYIQEMVQRQPAFALEIESVLCELVKSMNGSIIGTRRNFSFRAMNSLNRRFIHEMVPFYGCDAQSYDTEPNRNVIAYAVAGKCFLPATSLQQSYPTAFVGLPNINRSPAMARSRAVQLPASSGAWNPQFERVSSDLFRPPPTKPQLPTAFDERPQLELIERPRREKKEKTVSCFDDGSLNSGENSKNSGVVSAQSMGAEFMAEKSASKSSLAVATVPDSWEDN